MSVIDTAGATGARLRVWQRSSAESCRGIRHRAAPCWSVAVVVALALAGCSASQRVATTPSSSTTPATGVSASPTASVDRAILSAYTGMWADMQKAALTADYASPLLADHTVDPATGQLRRTLLTFHRLGWIAKGAPVPHPRVTSLSPSTAPQFATVNDCLDETRWFTYDAATGKPTDSKPGARFAVTAQLRDTISGWRVEEYSVGAAGSC